jgi:hypothetical protein
MGKKAIVKGNKIKCIRGPVADMNIIVKDKQGTEWYSKLTKDQFTKHFQDDYGVQVYDQAGQPAKKFLKGFLTFISEFETELKNVAPPKKTSSIIDNIMHTDIPDIDPEDIGQALALIEDPIVAIDSEGIPVDEDDKEDAPQEEDQLRIVDNPNEKGVTEI